MFPVTLDHEWTLPAFAQAGRDRVTIVARYAVAASPEATAGGAWVGHVESAPMELELSHW